MLFNSHVVRHVVLSREIRVLRPGTKEINLSKLKDPDSLSDSDGPSAAIPVLVTNHESEPEIGSALSQTVQSAIERTIRAKLHASLRTDDFSQNNQDALELISESQMLLIKMLRGQESDHKASPILDMQSYASTVAGNVVRHYLRKKYPLRQQLRSSLRYLLTHHPAFELWADLKSSWLCGFKIFKEKEPADRRETRSITDRILDAAEVNDMRKKTGTIRLLTAVFEISSAPLLFDELLVIVSEIQSVKDQTELSRFEDAGGTIHEPSDSSERADQKLESKELLMRVWAEILSMPRRHRVALVLNLKDKRGDCVVSLLPLLRIASVREIARSLGFGPTHFAEIWKELPWDDKAIAKHLEITRQQVINLRQSARVRLVRRLGHVD